MYSAVGSGLKSMDLALAVGVTWCPKAEEEVLRRRELPWFEKCKS